MKKKPTAAATPAPEKAKASPEMALATIGGKATPPLTKQQVLQATAIAIHAERIKKSAVINEQMNEIVKRLCTHYTKSIEGMAPDFESATRENWGPGNVVQAAFTISAENLAKGREIEGELAKLRHVDNSTPEKILKELKEASATSSVVFDLAKDPEIAKRLAKAGNDLLTQFMGRAL